MLPTVYNTRLLNKQKLSTNVMSVDNLTSYTGKWKYMVSFKLINVESFHQTVPDNTGEIKRNTNFDSFMTYRSPPKFLQNPNR